VNVLTGRVLGSFASDLDRTQFSSCKIVLEWGMCNPSFHTDSHTLSVQYMKQEMEGSL